MIKNINLLRGELLNSIMLILSFLVSIFLPFDTFLFSYAVLGPLHYLTELHWLKSKKFFLQKQQNPFNSIFSISLIIIPIVILVASFYFFGQKIDALLGIIIIGFFLIAYLLAHFSISRKVMFLLVIAIVCLLLGLFYAKMGVLVILGVFIPTLIHVYFFTGLFMINGYLKKPSILSFINFSLLFIVPFVIYFIPIESFLIDLKSPSEKIYSSTNFKNLNDWMITTFNIAEHNKRTVFIKIQIFIAFAYTYHYLNWFVKTSIIGWTKNLSLKKGILVLAIWILSIALYWNNYQLGLTVLFVLSMMHVLAEFPLNAISINTIIRKIFRYNDKTKRKY